MFALKRRAIGVSVAAVAAASLTASLLISTALAQTPDPSISSIVVSNITMNSATVTVNLADAPDGTTVYLKYGPVNQYNSNPKPPAYNVGSADGESAWTSVYSDAPPLEQDSTSNAVTFDLPDSELPSEKLFHGVQRLWSSYEVKVEASLDSAFASVETETFTTLPPQARINWVNGEQTQMGLQATLSNLSGVPQTVHYRWREVGTTTWNTGSVVVPWGNPSTQAYRLITGLTSHTQYEVEASLDPSFPADKTVTRTASTRIPEVVRVGVRKITETDAVITGVMDVANGKTYHLVCQAKLDGAQDWTPASFAAIRGSIGKTAVDSLTADSDYGYRCRLSWRVAGDRHSGRNLEGQTHTLDGTSTALTEISATLSGDTATITVTLANTDGTNNDVYLRQRTYPDEEWSQAAGTGTTTDTAQFTISGITGGTIQEFEASLDSNYTDEKKVLTLYLETESAPATPPSPPTPPTPPTPVPEDTTNENADTENENTDPTEENDDTNSENTNPNPNPNNNQNSNSNSNTGGGGGGGGFGGGFVQRNTAPNFRDSAGKMRTVPENSAEDVEVGEPIMAWDPENDDIEFSLRGADSEPFKIKKLTSYSAQLLVGPEAVLDYEAQGVHMVTVVATDPGNEEKELVIEVRLTDVKLPGRADEFDVANNHDEHLDREEVEAANAALGLNLLTLAEMAFIMEYYYETNFAAIDFANFVRMVAKYDLNADSVIDRDEVLSAFTEFQAGNISKEVMQEILKTYYDTSMPATQPDPQPTT